MKGVVALLFAVFASACGGPVVGPGPTAPVEVESLATRPSSRLPTLGIQLITDQLSEPVAAATRPGDGAIYVAERAGRIIAIEDERRADEPYLDITSQVFEEDREQGLLGVTFHPDGDRLFVLYTDESGAVIVAGYSVGPSGVDLDTRSALLIVDQPFKYHQGGALEFGPDGYLWIGLGDGGLLGDRENNAQNPEVLLGSILRLDVDAATPYAIPPTNPFVDAGDGAAEVWAYGLRNPWRIAFDGGYIYIADVGHYEREEINVVSIDEPGANFGWAIREGDICFEADECTAEGLTEPTIALPHERLCAVVGGSVYRGEAIPELNGHYLYGDFCTGSVRSLIYDGEEIVDTYDWSEQVDLEGQLTTFGLDPDGEVLLATQKGELYRLVALR